MILRMDLCCCGSLNDISMYQTFCDLVFIKFPLFHHAKRYEGHQVIHDIISFDGGRRHAIGLHDCNDGGQICLYRMCSISIFTLAREIAVV